jgi:hypothetical protein
MKLAYRLTGLDDFVSSTDCAQVKEWQKILVPLIMENQGIKSAPVKLIQKK